MPPDLAGKVSSPMTLPPIGIRNFKASIIKINLELSIAILTWQGSLMKCLLRLGFKGGNINLLQKLNS
jgi:hypothetical protein